MLQSGANKWFHDIFPPASLLRLRSAVAMALDRISNWLTSMDSHYLSCNQTIAEPPLPTNRLLLRKTLRQSKTKILRQNRIPKQGTLRPLGEGTNVKRLSVPFVTWTGFCYSVPNLYIYSVFSIRLKQRSSSPFLRRIFRRPRFSPFLFHYYLVWSPYSIL